MKRMCACLCLSFLLLLSGIAGAAEAGASWLEETLAALQAENQAAAPVFGGREAGCYWLRAPFGAALVTRTEGIAPDAVREIDITDAAWADELGGTVGLALSERAYAGAALSDSGLNAASGSGGQWVWSLDGAPCALVWRLAEEGSTPARTLTYLLDDAGRIAAIHVVYGADSWASADRAAPVNDLLGQPISGVVARLGEPESVQALEGNDGRLLVYPDFVLRAALEAQTGEEVLREIAACGRAIAGPGGVRVGMTQRQALALLPEQAEMRSAYEGIELRVTFSGVPLRVVLEGGVVRSWHIGEE